MELLQWAFLSLGISLTTGVIGFSGAAHSAATLARNLCAFFLFVALFLCVIVVLGGGNGIDST
jgi:uncharacterized membrane protein YtjA (UPF0391 family)